MSPSRNARMKRGQTPNMATACPRLTRLRAKLAGAPPIMKGLDVHNRATEPLPHDPDNISTAEVKRLLASRSQNNRVIKIKLREKRRRIRIILHTTRMRTPSPAEGAAMTTPRSQRGSAAQYEPKLESPDRVDLMQIPVPASPSPAPTVCIELSKHQVEAKTCPAF